MDIKDKAERIVEGGDPEQVIKSLRTEATEKLDRGIKEEIIETAAGEAISHWEDYMPTPNTGTPSEINRTIEVGIKHGLDPIIQIESQGPEGVEIKTATVTTTQHNEKIGLDIEHQRNLGYAKSYDLEFARELDYRGYIDHVGEGIAEAGLFNKFDAERLKDAYAEYEKSGMLTGKLEDFMDEVYDIVAKKAREVQEDWAKRYLRYLNNKPEVIVQGVNL